MKALLKSGLLLAVIFALLSCAEKNPPRDEIPLIKDLLGKIDRAVRDRNAAQIDSLMIADALKLGYNSETVLKDVYPEDTSTFYTFGRREFFYTEDKGVVNCFIMADSADSGRPVEMTLVKANDHWYLKRFDLK